MPTIQSPSGKSLCNISVLNYNTSFTNQPELPGTDLEMLHALSESIWDEGANLLFRISLLPDDNDNEYTLVDKQY